MILIKNFVLIQIVIVMVKKKKIINLLNVKMAINFVLFVLKIGMMVKNVM